MYIHDWLFHFSLKLIGSPVDTLCTLFGDREL